MSLKKTAVFVVGDGGPVQNGLAPVVSDDDPVHSKTQLLGADVGPEAYIELGKLPDEKTKEEEDSDRESTTTEKVLSIVGIIIRFLFLIGFLYLFICSLGLLSDGFILIGGRVAGTAFQNNDLLKNPICGLMIGVVATAFLQSSSTSTSIIITMVASGLFSVKMSIPMIMGANIGTSITGILVATTQAGDRRNFELAFSGATVHDMFNWLTVIVLLPIEIMTNYLLTVTDAIVASAHVAGDGEKTEFLTVITKPFTKFIIQVDKSVMGLVAAGDPRADEMPIMKYWCKYEYRNASELNLTDTTMETVTAAENSTLAAVMTISPTVKVGVEECSYIFHGTALQEAVVGAIILLIALVMLVTCLIGMVAILKKLLAGSMAKVIQRTINADFPGKAACFTGYAAIIVGAILTILVQSSSVVTSALTPLVGLGVVTLERVFPMMLGANIGTTSTAILASFAASSDTVQASFQIALCHLFFNLTGILIWYPLPFMRKIPINIARFLGRTTARYRWFAVVYLVLMFFVLPLSVFGLSLAGWEALAGVGIPFIAICLIIGLINLLQSKRPQWLPDFLKTWEFLPEPLRSLEPMDRLLTKLGKYLSCSCCQPKSQQGSTEEISGIDGCDASNANELNGVVVANQDDSVATVRL